MSSRRLLVLINALGPKSDYQTARRNGDWCDEEYTQAAAVNEIKLLRVDQAGLNGQKMETTLLESPAQRLAKADVEEEHTAVRAGILAQLHGQDLGKKA